MIVPFVSVKKRLRLLVLMKRTVPPPPIIANGLASVLLVKGPLTRNSEPEAMNQPVLAVTFMFKAKTLIPALLVSVPFKVDALAPLSVKPPLGGNVNRRGQHQVDRGD